MASAATKVAAAEAAPYSFTRAGYYYGGYADQGKRGNYWVRTPQNDNYAYVFYYNASSFYPQINNAGKAGGYSIRCVFGS